MLRADVEKLLRAQEDIGSFQEQPRIPAGVTTDQSTGQRPGAVIGPYKLVEQIGEGGMGTVWMAQQTEPVKRVVALKLIKSGMDSKQVIARFEAESQALALMDQFIPVCQAVQHAHQKGVIHRDLKPSNVLVALYDDRPMPKIIDFGVAKATGQPLTEETLHTGFGAVVGTLEYMSPEQASLNQLDVDTRSDVYGHEKGAFTGAISQKIGRFELANRGTLFLDEVGDIPPCSGIAHASLAGFSNEVALVQSLFREYADSLGIDLAFHGFEKELARLPGNYAITPQRRRLLRFRWPRKDIRAS